MELGIFELVDKIYYWSLTLGVKFEIMQILEN